MRYTAGGRAALEAYVARLRRTLGDRADVNPDDVAAGIKEHVDAELASRQVETATGMDVAEVLEQLGGAEQVAGGTAEGGAGAGPSDLLRRLAVLLVLAVASVAGLALLLAPAVLVWGQAQIGGFLEGPLAQHVGVSDAGGPASYWLAMLWLAGAATGVWWVMLALALRSLGARLPGALGPARDIVSIRDGRTLLIVGSTLFIVSLMAWWFA